jgi:HemK-like putative methylase
VVVIGSVSNQPPFRRPLLDQTASSVRAVGGTERTDANPPNPFPHHPTRYDLEQVLSAARRRKYEALIERRVAGEPAALIIGKTSFRGLDLTVRRGVFIPRSRSELLAGEAVRRLRGRFRLLAVDVGTGAGPIAIAIAPEVRSAFVWGVDISRQAISLARANAKRLGITKHILCS